METQTDIRRPSNNNNNGQLIFVPHKDTIRLLEVYVKRSLSLNDGTLGLSRTGKKEKWVTMPKKQRRHSSDPSLPASEFYDEEIGGFTGVDNSSTQPETQNEVVEKRNKKPKKIKKPSFWKNLVSIFTGKSVEEEEQDCPPDLPEVSQAEEGSDAAINCLPTTPVPLQKKKTMRRKSLRRRFSKRRLSFNKINKPGKDGNEITKLEDAVSVEPTYSYYEKVSEELEKIVNEVKDNEEDEHLSAEELINRIIALTKQEGDAIDDKMKDNPTLSNFFQGMSYSYFQQLADAYLEKEATPANNPPTVIPTAPELVKLAFTLDFTARIAGLSRQNVGHITGLGNRYLQDRFEYQQACTDHPWSDSDD